jgi:IS5 family transposase
MSVNEILLPVPDYTTLCRRRQKLEEGVWGR